MGTWVRARSGVCTFFLYPSRFCARDLANSTDRLTREKQEFPYVYIVHTGGRNSVMSNSKVWLELEAYVALYQRTMNV